jgi:hypothetical protein
VRVAVHDLGQELVFLDMQAGTTLGALGGDTRADDLRQAVDVDGGEAESALDLVSHRVGPGLGTEHADLELERAGVDACRLERLGDVKRIGRRRAQDLPAEILQQHGLALGHAARDRHDRAAERFGAVMEAQPAREQAVAIGVVHHHPWPHASRDIAARHHLRPHGEVGAGVADQGRLAMSAARRVDPRQLADWNGAQAERIVLAQVGFLRERQLAQVGETANVVGDANSRSAQPRAERRHRSEHTADLRAQAIELQRLHLLARQRLDARIPHHAPSPCAARPFG